MPIYEYTCQDCGKNVEILIRSADQKPACPCGSENLKRKFSAFAVSDGGPSASVSGCADGSCGLPSSPCASGMCGLN